MYLRSFDFSLQSLGRVCFGQDVSRNSLMSQPIQDNVTLSKHYGPRIDAYNAYNDRERSKHMLFCFGSDGEITMLNRRRKSPDLYFLDHVRTNTYAQPPLYDASSIPLSQQALEQSNRLACNYIPPEERIVDGFKYHGPNASFNSGGEDISRFRSGDQEITVIDRKNDKVLAKTIEAFKSRLDGKNLSDKEKIKELLSFVDEVFSLKETGSETEELVRNIMYSEKQVYLGDIINSGAGMCRHRSLLTKILGDEIGLKTALVQGSYAGGGHAWNEVTTRDGETFLLDAMHGNLFNVSNIDESVMPQVFHYRESSDDNSKMKHRYLDPESVTGKIYRCLEYKKPNFTIHSCKFASVNNGGALYEVTPSSFGDISINGIQIKGKTLLHKGDWVQIRSLGFQI